MLHEHDLGRSLVDTLADLSQQRTPWSDDDRGHLEQTARAYTKMLREHIQKEDRVLYPLAQRRLSDPVKQEISTRFLAALLFEDLASPIEVP